MPFLPSWLAKPLPLPYGETTYLVPPPTKEAGAKLAALNALGAQAHSAAVGTCATCGRSGEVELPEETRDLLAAIKDEALGDIALTPDVHARMLADGVPEVDIDRMALYSMYFWTLGEAAADRILEITYGGGEASGEAPAGPTSPQPKPRTASGSRSGTSKMARRSTPPTAPRRKR